MRTFEIKTKRDEKKIPVERVFIDTGETMFRVTLDIDGKLRINKIDMTENFEHSMNVKPASGNEILIS